MWKYQCKRHLLILLGSFVIGAVLFGVFGYERSLITAAIKQSVPAELLGDMLQQGYIYYLVGGFAISGLLNGLLLMTYAMQRYNIPFIALFLVFLFGGSLIIESLGALLVIPAIIVCIYGMLTIPNRGQHKEFAKDKVSSVQEVERVYRLHHAYLSEYEDMGKKVWSFSLKMNMLYAVGLACILLVILYVNDLWVIIIAMMLYSMLFFQLTKRKQMAMQPIIALLYDQCNPEACATAIFALANKGKRKKNFPLAQHLAQCMIYLNDPHLAIDVLATCNQNRGSFVFAYYSLMAYAYYQLGDNNMVKYYLNECEKAGAKAGNGPMQMIRQQCQEGIQNRLDLMEQNFNSSRSFYQRVLPTVGFEFQRVDFYYYLGLIAYVEKDLEEAERCFRYVRDHGNTMYFAEKARTFLTNIEQVQAAKQAQEAAV